MDEGELAPRQDDLAGATHSWHNSAEVAPPAADVDERGPAWMDHAEVAPLGEDPAWMGAGHEAPTQEMAALGFDERAAEPDQGYVASGEVEMPQEAEETESRSGRPRWRMPSPPFTDGRQGILEDIVTACTEGWRRAAQLLSAGLRRGGDGNLAMFDEVADYILEVSGEIHGHLGGFAFAVAHDMGLPDWATEAVGRGVVALSPLPLDVQLGLAPPVIGMMGDFLDVNDVAGEDGLVPEVLPHGTVTRLADHVAALLDPLGEIPREKVSPRSRALDVSALATGQVRLSLMPSHREPPPPQPPSGGHEAWAPAASSGQVAAIGVVHDDPSGRTPATVDITRPAMAPDTALGDPFAGLQPWARSVDHAAPASGPHAAPAPAHASAPAPAPAELSDDVAECLRRARSIRIERRYAPPRIAGG